MLLPCDYWPKLVDPLIKDGGTTKSAKSQLIKMHLCEVSISTSVMDAILKCAPSCNCSKRPKRTIKLFKYGNVQGVELVEGSRLF